MRTSCFWRRRSQSNKRGLKEMFPQPFLNTAWIPRSSWFMYCWSLAWRILSITWLECEMSAIVQQFEHSLALPFFGIGMKTNLFQFCGHCWGFQICWHIESSTFTASSFRIWNSSARIPSPPLALFVVVLPKAHLTLHSRMSTFGNNQLQFFIFVMKFLSLLSKSASL